MERTTLYEDDLTEERLPTPEQREENSHVIALDPDVDDDDEENEDEEDESEDLDD